MKYKHIITNHSYKRKEINKKAESNEGGKKALGSFYFCCFCFIFLTGCFPFFVACFLSIHCPLSFVIDFFSMKGSFFVKKKNDVQ